MSRFSSHGIIGTIAPVISLSLIVLAWSAASHWNVMPRSLLAPPDQAARSLFVGFVTGDIWHPLLETLIGTSVGYAIGSLLAVASAAVLANSKWAERFLMAHVLAFQAIPKVALAPLIFIWCGFGLLSNVILVAMSCYYPVFANAFVGFRATDPNLISMYRAFGSSRSRILFSVQLPAAASYIFVGLEVGVVFALIAEVVMEFISGRPGLGSLIQETAATLDSASAFGALILLALLGISASALVRLARWNVVFWDRRHDTEGVKELAPQ
ncbi:ABC transporter permease subunit [Bradyrhizobium sp. AUGA SZCCT0240]|uniref:ABC transporter permease n=1 Tax=Bradyrhizobium sp. AUGA SZCCT0240 TaxID=2807669 RepID=UPI001BA79076|nr:ABC transporter permease subunit [Bradyrhizobium sp. AUGA SZCCT0240]MBR1256358.1 ABC transporter permease subunit [Bradyrhizobium sp. AUGA SZCCT0240]